MSCECRDGICCSARVSLMCTDAQVAAKPEDDLLSGQQPMHMLLFGDSVDYRVARHLCNVSKHQEVLEPFGSDPIGQEHNMTGASLRMAYMNFLRSNSGIPCPM